MDGVVLARPPTDPTERMNFCKYGETYIWRKPSERCSPELAGDGDYGNQVPLARAVPMWGGCSPGGFSVVLFHKFKPFQPASTFPTRKLIDHTMLEHTTPEHDA